MKIRNVVLRVGPSSVTLMLNNKVAVECSITRNNTLADALEVCAVYCRTQKIIFDPNHSGHDLNE